MTINPEELARNLQRLRTKKEKQATNFSGSKETAIIRCAFYLDSIPDAAAGERRFDLFSERLNEAGVYIEKMRADDMIERLKFGTFDAVIFPGGTVNSIFELLGERGAEVVTRFVCEGGGWLGSCAGGFIPSLPYLGLLGASLVGTTNWQRGVGPVKVQLTEEGRKILGAEYSEVDMYFRGGPLFIPKHSVHMPTNLPLAAATVLGTYTSEMAEKNKLGYMIGTGAVMCGEFGKGRIIVFGPHPECSSYDLIPMLRRALYWSVRKEIPKEMVTRVTVPKSGVTEV